jgi:hypothetical protein
MSLTPSPPSAACAPASKPGNDRIPHLSFWLDLPLLVRDGCIYFLYLCKLAAFKVGILSVAPDSPVAAPPPAYSSSSGSRFVCIYVFQVHFVLIFHDSFISNLR